MSDNNIRFSGRIHKEDGRWFVDDGSYDSPLDDWPWSVFEDMVVEVTINQVDEQ